MKDKRAEAPNTYNNPRHGVAVEGSWVLVRFVIYLIKRVWLCSYLIKTFLPFTILMPFCNLFKRWPARL